ncbi:MAG: hypothetical protein D6677_13225 [Calditrichaeota bacterium]|nr:MAG: hypothetical protein D6677_13225 [Calditrichota bacterium]
MKTLIGIVVFIAVLLGIVAVVPLFIDPEVNVSRSIEIQQSPEVVFTVIKNYDLYPEWIPWTRADKDAEYTIDGEPGDVGSTWSWNGDTVGQGSLTLAEIRPNSYIKGKLSFYKPWVANADDLWQIDSLSEEKSRVTWTYHTVTDGYLMRFMNLRYESILGPEMERGLKNLKTFVENLERAEDMLNNFENIGGHEE